MKRPIRNVRLLFSCPEKWENMEDVGHNKYCRECKHLVVDFTKLSQQEYDEALKNAQGRLCGRFKSSQMSPRFFKYVAAASALSASVFATVSCTSDDPVLERQVAPPVEQFVEEKEFELAGIVFIPDSTMSDADTTLLEEPFDEDAYFQEERNSDNF